MGGGAKNVCVLTFCLEIQASKTWALPEIGGVTVVILLTSVSGSQGPLNRE